MAWRIHDSVIRGEMDNRVKGLVRGRVWLRGLDEPVTLELKGNACPDLAGCLLTFENPGKTLPMPADATLNPLQRGAIGDLTASRKVRVPGVPNEEFIRLSKAGLPVPEHRANCLYLEWFSEANGRVVIESADYRLNISPPSWQLTPEEERQRAKQAASGFAGFLRKLNDAVQAQRHQPPEGKEWDEFDYEKLFRESDAHMDKFMELLDKYTGHPDAKRLIAREMGRDAGEDFGGEADEHLDVDEIKCFREEAANELLEPDPATEGVDWIRNPDGDIEHPLCHRAFESGMALWDQCDALGLAPSEDGDLSRVLREFENTDLKLAGALNDLAYGRDQCEGPFIVAYLKRALNHLHAAQAALEKVAPKNLLPANILSDTRKELFEIREEILRLMTEFRA